MLTTVINEYVNRYYKPHYGTKKPLYSKTQGLKF